MKTPKSIHPVYEDSPFDQWALDGNDTQCQDIARKSLAEQQAGQLKLRTHHLISEVHRLLQGVDANFDTAPQRELMKSIACHVNDAAMLALIEAWLEISIEASDGNGKRRSRPNHC
jgi:hypothetical protein